MGATHMEARKLNNGIEIPVLGFGTFQIPPEKTEAAVSAALKAGYRHIDTAQGYFNEIEVGQALSKTEISRDQLFITTKIIAPRKATFDKIKKAVNGSLQRLGLEYIDLVLIHQPFGDIEGTWQALQQIVRQGQIKAIGISNFSPDRLKQFSDLLLNTNSRIPQINQIEVNPFHQQVAAAEFNQAHHISVEAWAPFAEGKNQIFRNPILSQIGGKYDKSVAQVIIRWLLQRNIVVLSKSTSPARMQQNLDVFDFELSSDDMKTITKLEDGTQIMDFDDEKIVKRWTRLIPLLNGAINIASSRITRPLFLSSLRLFNRNQH